MGAECFVFGSWKVNLCSWPSGRPLPSRGRSRLRSGGQRVGSHLWHMTGAAQALLLWGEGTCTSHVWKQPVPFSPTCSANTERRPLSSSFQDKHRPAARSSSQMQLHWALLDTPPHSPTPVPGLACLGRVVNTGARGPGRDAAVAALPGLHRFPRPGSPAASRSRKARGVLGGSSGPRLCTSYV